MVRFDFKRWKERIAKRSDITGMLTHLTKPMTETDGLSESEINILAIDTLIKILREQKIIGSTTEGGFIIGNTPAVCFQEVPLYSLVQNVEYEKDMHSEGLSKKVRYCGVGLCFSKFYAFDKGARPVIYEKKDHAKRLLPESEYWRIVSLNISVTDPNIIDWTHEREWRTPNNFEFDINLAHVLLYDKGCWDYFIANCPDDILKAIYGVTVLRSIYM